MKLLTHFLMMLLCVSVFSSVNAQNENLNIDPRQYITVYEMPIGKKKEKILLWKWQDNEMVNQKRKVVDVSSTIRIEFDKAAVANNINFKGNISIEAQLNGNPIEVPPYVRIGVAKKSIGLTSRPPTEISTIFVNLLTHCLEISVNFKEYDPKYLLYLLKEVVEHSEKINGLKKNESKKSMAAAILPQNLEALAVELKKIRPFEYDLPIEQVLVLTDMQKKTVDKWQKGNLPENDTLHISTTYLGSMKELIKKLESVKNTDILWSKWLKEDGKIEQFCEHLKTINGYINFFKSSGIQAEDAFLSFIKFDYIQLDEIQSKLTVTSTELSKQLKKMSKEPTKTEIDSIKYLYRQSIVEVEKLTLLEPTTIGKQLGVQEISESSKLNMYENIIKKKEEVINSIALKASQIIYLPLDYATIDLVNSNASDGSDLYISIILEEKDRRDNQVYEKKFPIGRYTVKKTGWHMDEPKLPLYLVHRINQPDPIVNTDVVATNFKPTPSFSVQTTRYRDGSDSRNIFNVLQPSFGINVSYLNFKRNSDQEFGAGVLMGLFRNRILLNTGVNLNMLRKSEQSPFFLGIGLNFSNLGSVANDFKKTSE